MRKDYFVVNLRNLHVLCCLLGAAAALNACAKDESVPGELCAETACKDANILAVCDAQTGISSERECAYGCENNACKAAPAADKCTETVCKDANILAVCDAQSGISFERECAYGCENNACKTAPAADKCTETVCKDANILAICDAQSGISFERECAYGCENNACKPKTGEDKCQEGLARCSADGIYAEQCEQGALWREHCANGCEDGACKKQTIYKYGEKCDSETFNAYCLDDFNLAVTCDDDGEISYEKCHFDEVCLTSQDGTQIGCYDKTEKICDNFGEAVTSCKTTVDSWISSFQKSEQCMLMSDGTGRLKTSYEWCIAGCAADGVNCAPEKSEDGKSCSVGMQVYCTTHDKDCAVFSGVAKCYNEAYICNEVNSSCVGEVDYYDEDDIETEYVTYITTSCIASDDGKAFIKKQEKCAIGCTEDGTKCEPHTADNKTCTPAASAWCQDQDYELCALYFGDVWCYDETEKCNADAAGEEIIVCDDENNIAYYYWNYIMDDGQTCIKSYWNERMCYEDTVCVGGKGCMPLKNDDGTCKDEVKQYCADEGYAHCAFVSDYAYCYNDEDVCSELNSLLSVCDGNVLRRGICLLADDNKTRLYLFKDYLRKYCENGCNPSANSCWKYKIGYESLACNESDKAACQTDSRDALCETVGGYGFCAHADNACNAAAEGKTKMRCAGARMTKDLLLTYACAKTDSNAYAWTKVNKVDSCDYGCSDGACLPLPTEESVCTEEQKSYCAGIGADSCVYVPANWPPYKPMCYRAEDVCTDGEDCPYSLSICKNGVKREYYSSKESADGTMRYYDAEDGKTENCAFGCNADNTACRLTADEGTTCSGQTFPSRCDGNVAVYCYDGVVTARPCDDLSENGEAGVCFKSLNSNHFGCFSKTYFENNSCVLNSEWSNCNDTWFGHAALVNHVCVSLLSHDGTISGNAYAQKSYEYCTDASGAYTACNADNTACRLTADEGTTCNADEFTERCDGNTVVYCFDGVVTTWSCDNAAEGGEAAICYISSAANYADCYTESDVTANACAIPSTDMYCDDETYEHAAFLTYSCAEFKSSDGSKTANLYYMSSGEYCVNADETAYTVCNDDNSACSDVLEGT